jgi:hypothetical protein
VPEPALDSAAAGRVARCVQIEDVQLTGCFFLLQKKLTSEELAGYHTAYMAGVKDLTDESLEIGIMFALADHGPGTGHHQDDDGDMDMEHVMEQPFVATADYVVTYRVTSDTIDRGNLDSFARINGIFNAWPYWRERVHGITNDMGLPKLVVPVFRVPLVAHSVSPKPRPSKAGGAKRPAKKPSAVAKTK